MQIKKTETYIINLNYNDYPRLKEMADSRDLCKMLLDAYPIQLRAVLDENTNPDEMPTYYFYIGLAMSHNLYELNCGAYLSSKEMLMSLQNGDIKIEECKIKRIAKDIEKMEYFILKKKTSK